MSENDEKEKPKQEFWSNNPNHKDYTTEGDKKGWAFYLTHRGKPKGQSPGGQSPEHSSEEKNGQEGVLVSDTKGNYIPPFHGSGHSDLHVGSQSGDYSGASGDNVNNDDSSGAYGDNGNNDQSDNNPSDNNPRVNDPRDNVSREVCLSQYPGDVEAQRDYDRAVSEGRDPVKAVEDGVARRKGATGSSDNNPRVTDPSDNGSRVNDSKEIKMAIILGKPNTRGNSDVVDNFDSEKLVLAGTVVKRTGDDTVAMFDGTGLPIGVAGYRQIEGQTRMAVNINGLGIGVLLANPAEEIAVGCQVYVTKEGKVTGVSKDNTALRAVFASGKGDGVDVLSKTKVLGGAVRIDMLGI